MTAIFAEVRSALVRTVLSAQALAPLPRRHAGTCMDVFGFDVMFDSGMSQPYVLEVNLAPALSQKQQRRARGGGGGGAELADGRGYTVNQVVHDRVLLHTIGMLSRRSLASAPPTAQLESLRARLHAWSAPLLSLPPRSL
eukprot:COSAG01_NODE_11821_length_1853_cov_1.941277_4_plen_140_part_00